MRRRKVAEWGRAAEGTDSWRGSFECRSCWDRRADMAFLDYRDLGFGNKSYRGYFEVLEGSGNWLDVDRFVDSCRNLGVVDS